jgi:hypothetical protein
MALCGVMMMMRQIRESDPHYGLKSENMERTQYNAW